MLEVLGFNRYEASVLEALIKLYEATAMEISETSGVPYGKIYEVLKSLKKKGFVEEIQRDKKYFRIRDFKRIESLVERSKGQIKETERFLRKYRELYKKREKEPVKILEGEEGFKVLSREIEVRDFFYTLKYFAEWEPRFVKKFKEFEKMGVEIKTLVRISRENFENIKKWLKIDKSMRGIKNSGVSMIITKNYVLISLLNQNRTILIKDGAFSDIMKEFFKNTWEKGKRIKL